MQLNLQQDFGEIYAYLGDRVRRFDPQKHAGLGGPGSVKLIEVGFEYSQAGWVIAVFDTRTDAEPDGEWTQELNDEENLLQRPHWVEAGEANIDSPITIVGHDGKKLVLSKGTGLAEVLGDLVKAVVLKAREDGLFAGLAKADRCELGVEHFSGDYGWPPYEEWGKDNLA